MSSKKFWFLLLIILPLIVSACGGTAERTLTAEELALLPTLVPSITPSLTPSDTPIPSETPIPSNTPTFTPTIEPTDTPSPTNTPTFTPEPTRTASPLPTGTATSQLTATPIPSPTPVGPFIASFTASSMMASGNTPITLTWMAGGEAAIIEQLDANNNAVQTFNVAVSGNLTVTLPAVGPTVTYRLVVTGASGQEQFQTLVIQVQAVCPAAWFFSNAPADVGCPAGPAVTIQGQMQQFQNGVMINMVYNGQNLVYGFNNRDNQYASYVSQWDGSSTYSDPACGTPGFGTQQPAGVFNWAFYNTLGTFGSWCNPQTGLGWATVQIVSTSFRIQTAQQSTTMFIDIPNYGILRLSGTQPIGTWSRLQ